MPVTADSFVSRAIHNLANLLAETDKLREVLAVDEPSEALEFIHWPVTLDRRDGSGILQHPRPRVLIGPYDSGGLRRQGVGGLRDYGILELAMEFAIPTEHRGTPKDALYWFQNAYGDILIEAMALGNQGGERLYVLNFEPWMGPDELDTDSEAPEDPNVYYGVVYHVHYGSN